MKKRTARSLFPLAVFCAAFLFITLLENHYRPLTKDGVHFHYWDSDMMIQTLPIQQLQRTPIESIWYLHIQPPMLDTIRAAVAYFLKGAPPPKLLLETDRVLYGIGSLFFALTAVLVFLWLSRLVRLLPALLFTALWILHPAAIFYASYLDSTLISSFGALWFFYELWQIKEGRGSAGRLAAALLFVFFTRTVFQWYFFPLALVSLALMGLHARRISLFIAVTALFAVPYLLKQEILFKTLSTTTFSGYHQCGIIWHEPKPDEVERARAGLGLRYPGEADRFSGGDPFNTQKTFEDNLIYSRIAKDRWLREPGVCFSNIGKSLWTNGRLFVQPPNQYTGSILVNDRYRREFYKFIFENRLIGTGHILNDRIPWRKYYDFLLSNYAWLFLLGLSSLIWLFRAAARPRPSGFIRRLAAFLLPFFYVIIVLHLSNRLYWSEAQRLRMLVEPLLYIFIVSQISPNRSHKLNSAESAGIL